MKKNVMFRINDRNLYEDLIFVDYIYPVLFTCVDDFENTYISACYFADASKTLWLLAKTDPKLLIDLLNNKLTIRKLFETDELWAICKEKNRNIQVKKIEDRNAFDQKAFPAAGEYMDSDIGEFDEEITVLKKRISSRNYITQPQMIYEQVIRLANIHTGLKPTAERNSIRYLFSNNTISKEYNNVQFS